MPIALEGWEVDAAEGRWRVEYIGEPHEYPDQDRVDYYLRVKWIDAHDPNNRATPERRLRIKTYSTHEAYPDFEERLKAAIYFWLEAPDETEATFDREHRYLLNRRAADQA
jgi:hypothetical protein